MMKILRPNLGDAVEFDHNILLLNDRPLLYNAIDDLKKEHLIQQFDILLYLMGFFICLWSVHGVIDLLDIG